jgi:hypothetical protein
LRLSETVVATDFPSGNGVLVDLISKKCYRVNETAMFVWHLLEQGAEVDAIAAALTRKYDVALEDAAIGVQRIVDDFRARDLLLDQG